MLDDDVGLRPARFEFTMPPEVKRTLREAARAEGVSLATFVRRSAVQAALRALESDSEGARILKEAVSGK